MQAIQEADTLVALKLALRSFSEERQWQTFHTPKNLAMALSVEVSEIVELFQWLTTEQSQQLTDDQTEQLADEIGDVLIYLTMLADRFGLDPLASAWQKMKKNQQKYPADQAKGSALKYTHYTPKSE